ncbi:response regulator transcription factor [Nocardiopsis xinjiangensis]|uniref:response regulator transcription factor n=1 Tax=Nocardiopsis xinjiangensis TaxID=124285 RepID=UPI00034BADA8|nr:response regulator [Nocardiopsis xinjiangensis]
MNALPARVLVVEDDEMIRELIRLNLELEGFEVFTAVDGQDCIDRVDHIAPHVVVLDVMMPRLDGWTVAEHLLARRNELACRIVLVTARAQEEDRRHGERIGVDAYMTKPFDPDALVEIVRELLEGEQE